MLQPCRGREKSDFLCPMQTAQRVARRCALAVAANRGTSSAAAGTPAARAATSAAVVLMTQPVLVPVAPAMFAAPGYLTPRGSAAPPSPVAARSGGSPQHGSMSP
jgi:hypothetical protein